MGEALASPIGFLMSNAKTPVYRQAGKCQMNVIVQNVILKSKTLNLFRGKVRIGFFSAGPGLEFNLESKNFGISFELLI